MKRVAIVAGLASLFVVVALAHGQDAEAKDLVAKAQELAKAKKFGEAAALMSKAVELEPKNDQYLGILSEFEYNASKFAAGLAHAQQALKLNEKVALYHILAAANAHWSQDLDLARGYCAEIIKRGNEFGPGLVREAQLIDDQSGKKVFTLHYNLDPKRGRMVNGSLAIAMPKDGLPYQHVTYEIGDVKSHKLVKGAVDDILHVVPQGTKPFTLDIKVTTQTYSFKKELAKAVNKPLPADAKAHLGAIVTLDPKSPVLQKVAPSLKSGDAQSTIANIQVWMEKNIDYKLDKKTITELDFKSVDEIVTRGHAECRGYAMLFVALCRACDVPARPIWGILRVPPNLDRKYGDIVSHNWAEVYIAGAGWVPIDPQRPGTLGFLPNYYMRMFMDAQKTKTSTETLPQANLMFMHDAKVLRFDEAK